ncbi:MAG: hypothetical protein AB7K86_12720 [Rhodospirillales bacterium]
MNPVLHALRSLAAAGLIAAAAAPAAADALVRADSRLDQHRTVRERGSLEMLLQIGITPGFAVDTAVTALAVAIAAAQGLSYDSRAGAPAATDAAIVDALRGNAGLVLLNQQAGTLNEQGNVVALGESRTGSTAAVAHGSAEQTQAGAVLREDAGAGAPAEWSAVATDALTGQAGVTGVNQAAGVANNQHVVIATASGVERPSVVADTMLMQSIATGFVESNGGRRRTLASGILNGNDGVSAMNQAAGFGNNQSSVFGLPLYVPLGVINAIGPSGIINR